AARVTATRPSPRRRRRPPPPPRRVPATTTRVTTTSTSDPPGHASGSGCPHPWERTGGRTREIPARGGTRREGSATRTATGSHRFRNRLVGVDLPGGHHRGCGGGAGGPEGGAGLGQAVAGAGGGGGGVGPGARRGHCRTQHRQPGGRRRRGAGAPVHAGARPGFGAVMSIERVLSLIASTITVVLDHPWVLLPIAAVALVAIILRSEERRVGKWCECA